MAYETVDGFEDGDTSEWSGINGSITATTNQSYSGSYSGEVSAPQNGSIFDGSSQSVSWGRPDSVRFYYYETSNNNNCGLGLYNGSTLIVGAGTENPQTAWTNGSGNRQTGSQMSYSTWVECEIIFDWANVQCDIYWSDGSNSESVTGYSLGADAEIDTIRVGPTEANSGSSQDFWIDEIQYDPSVSAPTSPQNVTLAIDSNSQGTVTWDAPSDWGGERGNYRIQLYKDATNWEYCSGGPNTVNDDGSASYSATYTSSTDSSYNKQFGIDASHRFRVRAENSAGNSSWVHTNTKHTTPVPPKNPTVNRPDQDTIELSWVSDTDLGTSARTDIEYRKDTGSGYSSWGNIETIQASSKGTSVSRQYSVSNDSWLEQDARYQFRIAHYHYEDWNNDGNNGLHESPYVYFDYGNNGNVYFEDDFESGDLSNWDSTNLQDSWGVYDSSFIDPHANSDDPSYNGRIHPVQGPDEGTYYLFGDGSGNVQKNLGDLSSESQVIVKCAMATSSMDSSSERIGIWWSPDGGSNWEWLEDFHHEYNRQGWVEVTARVPDSSLGTDCVLRLNGYGGSGDYAAWDRVVVSDIVHEWTTPTAPSNPQFTDSTTDSLTLDWSDGSTVASKNSGEHWKAHIQQTDGTDQHKDYSDPPTTYSGLESDTTYETYDHRRVIEQCRYGSRESWYTSAQATTVSASTDPITKTASVTPQSTNILPLNLIEPFELKADGQTDHVDYGLTSDSLSTGGQVAPGGRVTATSSANVGATGTQASGSVGGLFVKLTSNVASTTVGTSGLGKSSTTTTVGKRKFRANAQNDYVTLPSRNPGQSAFSISFIIEGDFNTSSATYPDIFQHNASTSANIGFWGRNGVPDSFFRFDSDSTSRYAQCSYQNKYENPTRITATFDPSVPEVRFYENGTKVKATSVTVEDFTLDNSLYIGNPHEEPSEVTVEDFRWYGRALSDSEVVGTDGAMPTDGLEIWLTFDDPRNGEVLDHSGNYNHGTIQGSPSFPAEATRSGGTTIQGGGTADTTVPALTNLLNGSTLNSTLNNKQTTTQALSDTVTTTPFGDGYSEVTGGAVPSNVSSTDVGSSTTNSGGIVFEDWEDGNTDGWTVNNGSLTTITSPSFDDYAVEFDNGANDKRATVKTLDPDGQQIHHFSFYWQEEGGDTWGTGLHFWNSDGNREFAVGTTNPQWCTDDVDGNRSFYSGDGYRRWIRFDVSFDWANGQYTLTGTDTQTGSQRSFTGNMYHGKDVAEISMGAASFCSDNNNWFVDNFYYNNEEIGAAGTLSSTADTGAPSTQTVGSGLPTMSTESGLQGAPTTYVGPVTFENAEDGDFSDWTVNEGTLTADSNQSIGTYSMFHDGFSGVDSSGGDGTNDPRGAVKALDVPTQISSFSFMFWESSSNTSAALSFYNSNGNREFSVGTDNPAWCYDDAGGNSSFGNPNAYEHWIRFTIDFDWPNDQYTVTGEDLATGYTASHTGTLKQGVDIAEIASGQVGLGGWTGSGQWHVDQMQYNVADHGLAQSSTGTTRQAQFLNPSVTSSGIATLFNGNDRSAPSSAATTSNPTPTNAQGQYRSGRPQTSATAGRFALEFDESGEEVTAPNDPIVQAWNNNREVTLSITISLDQINNQQNWQNIWKLAGSSDGGIRFERQSDLDHELRWTGARTGGNTNYQFAHFPNLDHGETYTLTVVVDYPTNGESRSYKDGELVGTDSDPGDTVDWTAGDWRLFFDGWVNFTVKEMTAWNRPLSQSEVQSHADGQTPSNGLIGHWRLNEGTGTQTLDATEYDNHGTISGGPRWLGDGVDATTSDITGTFNNKQTSGQALPDTATTTPLGYGYSEVTGSGAIQPFSLSVYQGDGTARANPTAYPQGSTTQTTAGSETTDSTSQSAPENAATSPQQGSGFGETTVGGQPSLLTANPHTISLSTSVTSGGLYQTVGADPRIGQSSTSVAATGPLTTLTADSQPAIGDAVTTIQAAVETATTATDTPSGFAETFADAVASSGHPLPTVAVGDTAVVALGQAESPTTSPLVSGATTDTYAVVTPPTAYFGANTRGFTLTSDGEENVAAHGLGSETTLGGQLSPSPTNVKTGIKVGGSVESATTTTISPSISLVTNVAKGGTGIEGMLADSFSSTQTEAATTINVAKTVEQTSTLLADGTAETYPDGVVAATAMQTLLGDSIADSTVDALIEAALTSTTGNSHSGSDVAGALTDVSGATTGSSSTQTVSPANVPNAVTEPLRTAEESETTAAALAQAAQAAQDMGLADSDADAAALVAQLAASYDVGTPYTATTPSTQPGVVDGSGRASTPSTAADPSGLPETVTGSDTVGSGTTETTSTGVETVVDAFGLHESYTGADAQAVTYLAESAVREANGDANAIAGVVATFLSSTTHTVEGIPKQIARAVATTLTTTTEGADGAAGTIMDGLETSVSADGTVETVDTEVFVDALVGTLDSEEVGSAPPTSVLMAALVTALYTSVDGESNTRTSVSGTHESATTSDVGESIAESDAESVETDVTTDTTGGAIENYTIGDSTPLAVLLTALLGDGATESVADTLPEEVVGDGEIPSGFAETDVTALAEPVVGEGVSDEEAFGDAKGSVGEVVASIIASGGASEGITEDVITEALATDETGSATTSGEALGLASDIGLDAQDGSPQTAVEALAAVLSGELSPLEALRRPLLASFTGENDATIEPHDTVVSILLTNLVDILRTQSVELLGGNSVELIEPEQ